MPDLGVRVSGDGSVHWDDRSLYNQIPPEGRGLAKIVIDCAEHGCSLDEAYHRTIDVIAAGLGAFGPIGLVAGGLLELVANWAPPRATIDWSWEAQFGAYDPGPQGSIWGAGNEQLRATYDGLLQSGKWPGSEAGVYAVLASQFSVFLNGWNASHEGPSGDWTITNTNRSTGSDAWHQHQPADWSPMAVAANWLAVQGGAPSPTTFHFAANAGAAVQPISGGVLGIVSGGGGGSYTVNLGGTTSTYSGGKLVSQTGGSPTSTVLLVGAAGLGLLALLKPALLRGLLRF
jgi:hypothetical protein